MQAGCLIGRAHAAPGASVKTSTAIHVRTRSTDIGLTLVVHGYVAVEIVEGKAYASKEEFEPEEAGDVRGTAR